MKNKKEVLNSRTNKLKQPGACYFFGTFDPIHLGHMKVADEIKAQFGFERIIFVPTHIPPHKETPDISNADRLQMLNLAVGKENVSEIEFEIEPPNYTYKAIEKLGKCAFIIGYDQFCEIENWKKTEYLKKMLDFVVIPRFVNHDKTEKLHCEADFAHLKQKGYNFKIAEFEPVKISSTQIRQCIQNGLPIDNLVSESVKNYIYEKRLYC